MLPQFALYQPTRAEVRQVTESAKRRHPEAAARIDKAADILFGGLQLEPLAWQKRQVVNWRVASQTGRGAYMVSGTSCPCQDSRAPMVCGGRRCKHSIATSNYLKILANRINADIRARKIDLGILPDGTLNAFAPRMGCVHLRKVGSAYVFCEAASAVRYSLWLATQPVALAA